MSTVVPFPLNNASDALRLSRDEVGALQKMLDARTEIEDILNRLTAIHNGIAALAAEETGNSSEAKRSAGGTA
ncbi:hypothetical protein QA646_20050 (plasmid) [Rhizobium sp. CB3090]|uniref:hypothetical protein n=1 Tax=Rhizobium sp. CB3090 TaxID=3039156 RepID=UPI0024B08211|nr:hypothetical protein [Rhizobium sp. CB3090]WFU12217.1 hypothetical protein QA646_20050 [Rhizobium sp. CB3090]